MSCGRMIQLLVMLTAAAVVAACCPGRSGHDDSAGPQASSSGASSEAAVVAASTWANSTGVQLQAVPSVLDQCTNAGRAVEISWQVASTQASSVKISVKGPDGDVKVWVEGGQTGKQATGAWVSPGMEFTLSDEHDKPLARLVIGSKACAK